jgi:hypothetical protein
MVNKFCFKEVPSLKFFVMSLSVCKDESNEFLLLNNKKQEK